MIDIQKYRSDFEAVLDSEGEIKIGLNFSMLPSQIIFELDEEAYKEQLLEYVDKLRVEHKEIVFQAFPAPIAYFYQQTISAYDNANHRLHLLRSTWESIIFVLYALVLGEVCSKGFRLSNIRVFNNRRIMVDHRGILSDRLGYKIEVIHRIIEYDQTNNQILDVSNYIEVDLFDELRELNQERHSFSHVSALSPHEATVRYNELIPKVSDLLFQLGFLEKAVIVRYVGNDGTITNLKFNKFEGHSLQKQNYDRSVTTSELAAISSVLNDDRILMEFGDILFVISPFIHFSFEGSHLKLCYYKQMDINTDELIFETIAGTQREIKIQNISLSSGIHNVLLGLI